LFDRLSNKLEVKMAMQRDYDDQPDDTPHYEPTEDQHATWQQQARQARQWKFEQIMRQQLRDEFRDQQAEQLARKYIDDDAPLIEEPVADDATAPYEPDMLRERISLRERVRGWLYRGIDALLGQP
jgi:hypothetical protein